MSTVYKHYRRATDLGTPEVTSDKDVTLTIDDRVHSVWYDADGKVLKVVVADSGFTAERTSQ